jgi:hypothetical protein
MVEQRVCDVAESALTQRGWGILPAQGTAIIAFRFRREWREAKFIIYKCVADRLIHGMDSSYLVLTT